MGRVYDINPDASKGERGGPGWHCMIWGMPINGVYRVELDEDSDKGPATVHALFQHGESVLLLSHDGSDAVRVTFRHNVRMEFDETTEDPILVDSTA